MDEKIKEVNLKLSQLKETKTNQQIDGIPIMKGSTLNMNIMDGAFNNTFFDQNKFQPMI